MIDYFEPDKSYEHTRSMDVFIYVISSTRAMDGSGYKLFVLWMNKGQCGEPYSIGQYGHIFISDEQAYNWKHYK